MRKIVLSLFFFGVCLNAYSQSGWVKQNPIPAGFLYGVDAVNQNTAYAVGIDGAIVKTTDGGTNWLLKPCGSNCFLYSIYFINENTGWAAGDSGTILKTSNGGDNWVKEMCPLSTYITNIFFTSDSLGFAAGKGYILRTTNGGQFWEPKYYSYAKWLYSIFFINNNTGWAAGSDTMGAVILKTTNGGNNWFAQNTNSYYSELISLYFLNAETGWASGGSYYNFDDRFVNIIRGNKPGKNLPAATTFLKTTDGGNNWMQAPSPGTGYLSSVYFTNANTGILIEAYSYSSMCGSIYKTTDGGNSWLTTCHHNNILISGSFSGNSGWAVGSGSILKTENTGSNWSSQLNVSTSTYRSFYPISPDTAWACGSNCISFTANGGTNWNTQYDSNTSYYMIRFINNNTGFVTGYDYEMNMGKILKTTNCGLNWNLTFLHQYYTMNCISFPSHDTGYAGGMDQYNYSKVLLKTTNEGFSWTTLNIGSNWSYSVSSIFFISATTGWICADEEIFKTTDGGTTWLSQYIGGYSYINSIFFSNSMYGWAASSVGSIYKTINGGNSWYQVYNNYYSSYFNSIYFPNPNTGWVCGDYGVILWSTNGGYNWSTQQSKTSEDLLTIYFTSVMTGWAAGSDGIILKTTDGGGYLIGINNESQVNPKTYSLSQNYPNPFNPSTKIKFSIPISSFTKLIIYDLLGSEIVTLVNEELKPREYEVEWNGDGFASGTYFYKLITSEFTETRKMVLVK